MYTPKNELSFETPFTYHANKQLKWLPEDTEERYLYNLSNRREDLEKWGWVGTDITYRFNSHGFRGDEFTTDGIMFLGCSFTFGVGVDEDSMWATQVGKNLSLSVNNLAVPGGSCDTAFRMCYGWIDKLKPKMCVFRRPPGIRMEVVSKGYQRNILIGNGTQWDEEWLVNHWGRDDMNNEFNFLKNYMGIRYMCEKRGIKLIYSDIYPPIPVPSPDKARDLGHDGKESNRLFAEWILELIEKEPRKLI